jgi:hypothetical protein
MTLGLDPLELLSVIDYGHYGAGCRAGGARDPGRHGGAAREVLTARSPAGLGSPELRKKG